MADYTPAQQGVLNLHLGCLGPPEPVLYLRTLSGDWRKFESTGNHVTTKTIEGAGSEQVLEAIDRADALSNHAGIVWGEKDTEQ